MASDFISENNDNQLSLDLGNTEQPAERVLFTSKNYEVVLVSPDSQAVNLNTQYGDEAYQVKNRSTKVVEVRTNAYPAALEVMHKLENAITKWTHELTELSNLLEKATGAKSATVTPINKKLN